MDSDDPNKQQHADTGEHEGDDDPPPESQPTGGGGTTMPRLPAATRERQRSTSREMAAPGGGRLQTEGGGDGSSGQGRSRGPKRSRAAVEEGQGQGAGTSSGVVKPRKKPQEFDAPAVASPCSVCGRRFGSWKALFGHMRSHPDRDWRGIHPPPKFNREGTPEDQDATMKERAEDLLLGVAQEVAARFGAEPGVVVDEERKKEAEQQQQEQQHRCTICSQLFPSGPALGGHMRTHSLSDRQFQASTSTSTSTARRRGLGIDLNLPNDPADHPQKGSPSSPEGGFDLNRRPSPDEDQQE